MSTADWEQRIREGDVAALAAFVEHHRPQLLAYIARNLRPGLRAKVEPEDILQEISVEAIRRVADAVRIDRDLFGWLCQIAEYRLIDAHRRFFETQKRNAGQEVGIDRPVSGRESEARPIVQMLVASLTSPSQAFSRDQREIRLHAAVASLPADAREALRLRYVEELPTKVIAERLGRTHGALRVLLSRSLDRLKQAYEELGDAS